MPSMRGRVRRWRLPRALFMVIAVAAALLSGCADTQEITVAMKDRVSKQPKLQGIKILVETPALQRRVEVTTDRYGTWIGEVPCHDAQHPTLSHRVTMTYQGLIWEKEFKTDQENCSTKRSIIFMWVKQGAPVR